MVCDEPTYEGLVKLLHRGKGFAGIFSSEGGQLIGGFAMSSDHRLKTCTGFSRLFDGQEITRVRGGEGSVLLYGRRLCHASADATAWCRPVYSTIRY